MSTIEHSRARSVADLAEGTILATVEIAAPPERVFRALSSKEIVEWWGSDDLYRTTEWTGDVRVGGRWKCVGKGADGKPFSVGGEYVEVDAPRKLAHTWESDWDPTRTTVSYRLEPIEGGTLVTLRHTGFTSRESCRGHGDGWVRVLGWLTSHLTKQAAPRSYFMIRLIPPRPSFALDMNEDEKRMMQEHAGYWRKLLAQGVAVAFGPVADPKGPWGLGVVEVDSADAVKAIEADDPAIKSGRGLRYEVLPMMTAVVRSS